MQTPHPLPPQMWPNYFFVPKILYFFIAKIEGLNEECVKILCLYLLNFLRKKTVSGRYGRVRSGRAGSLF